MGKKREVGTGVFIPEHIWVKALPTMKKDDVGGSETFAFVAVKLWNGQVIDDLVVGWDREIKIRKVPDEGRKEGWTKKGMDFISEDIVAMRVDYRVFYGFLSRTKWFS
jgi:hypothetical protein